MWLEADAPERLAALLADRGYRVIAPRVRDGALVVAEVDGAAALPTGWYDETGPGRYRLARRPDSDPRAAERFGFTIAAQAWKPFLHPPEVRLFRAERASGGSLRFTPEPPPERPLAFLGVRPCDLAAIGVQDRALTAAGAEDDVYAGRRQGALLIVVECGRANATCFCASMGTGPGARDGFDLALTELLDADRHGFLARAGSDRGRALLEELGARPASDLDLGERQRLLDATARSMTREVDGEATRAALAAGAELPMWGSVAERCLTCGNCTLVCATCFCTTVRDTSDVAGGEAERWRSWDSCFGLEFSAIHGGTVRSSAAARYRQWLTHKLGSWHQQFGESGCVGCGRCIVWCPVGIDITAEAATAVREAARSAETAAGRGGRG